MIDLGLSKLALIGVVALIVVGPEKLPKLARMAGSLFGRAQRYINDVKAEVSREIELDELRKMQKEVQQTADNIERNVKQELSQAEHTIHSAWDESTRVNPQLAKAAPDLLARKAENFRRKKLARSSAVPAWYKRQSKHKTHVISAAARVARYRPASNAKSSHSFH